jgi:predicted small lipoprotein YifL
MRWTILLLLTLQAATCGQKGPLTLPEPEAVAAAIPAVAVSIQRGVER